MQVFPESGGDSSVGVANQDGAVIIRLAIERMFVYGQVGGMEQSKYFVARARTNPF